MKRWGEQRRGPMPVSFPRTAEDSRPSTTVPFGERPPGRPLAEELDAATIAAHNARLGVVHRRGEKGPRHTPGAEDQCL